MWARVEQCESIVAESWNSIGADGSLNTVVGKLHLAGMKLTDWSKRCKDEYWKKAQLGKGISASIPSSLVVEPPGASGNRQDGLRRSLHAELEMDFEPDMVLFSDGAWSSDVAEGGLWFVLTDRRGVFVVGGAERNQQMFKLILQEAATIVRALELAKERNASKHLVGVKCRFSDNDIGSPTTVAMQSSLYMNVVVKRRSESLKDVKG
ncbi:hypothetical protein RIF29_34523 [Crotalaria pallida]|uniref:Uncharacterized protein n=1 Tax=Crotalaria pallida TaxID=3830 RepID=A0AAN9HXF5_CROPI